MIYNNKTYAVLSHADPNGAGSACQSGYMSVEPGFVLAPQDADSLAVIAAHKWSTTVVILANGVSYFSKSNALYSNGANKLRVDGSTYDTSVCPGQILQVS